MNPYPDTPSVGTCGNSVCNSGENCWNCSLDCQCYCGDGVCTHGEFCAICEADCDCATLAATPPMGWNSWNLFACDIDEDLIRTTAEQMVESGMAAAGYNYVNLDDCWQIDRDEDGTILADPDRFPAGIPALAEYVHDLGLKFGLYTCAGTLTCQERPGSYGYEYQDAKSYASWGVDLVKVDWCFTDGLDSQERYGIFRDALLESGREMLLSICNWGFDSPWLWGPSTGSMWRTSPDIFDHPLGMAMTLFATEPLAPFATVGHWNDPDMLEVGNGGMTHEQYKAHMSLWAILAAPLLAGNDIRSMSQETADILLNEEVIAVDQDPYGHQGVLLHSNGPVRVYGRPLKLDGLRAAVFYNTDLSEPHEGKVSWKEFGLQPGDATVRDLWARSDLGIYQDSYSATVPPGGAVMVKILGREPLLQSGDVRLSDLPFLYEANWGGKVRRNANAAGKPLTLQGTVFQHGLGVTSGSQVAFHIAGRCSRFTASAGLDSTSLPGATGKFLVVADGEALWSSEEVGVQTGPLSIDLDTSQHRTLVLQVKPGAGRDGADLANWADPVLVCD